MAANLSAALAEGTALLKRAGMETPALDARLLLCHAAGISHEALLLEKDAPLTLEAEKHYRVLLSRRLRHEPMAYLLGCREFWGLSLAVERGVLIPRPDTETVVEAVLSHCPDRDAPWRILDLGTGSGALLLSLLSEYRNASGTGVDASPEALAVAHKNACNLGFAGRARFTGGKWCEKVEGKYEIIVANPPYIPSNEVSALMVDVADYEPHLALDGGSDGLLCYREIASCLPKHASSGAIVALEVGVGQHVAVGDIFEEAGFRIIETRADLAGIGRCVVCTH